MNDGRSREGKEIGRQCKHVETLGWELKPTVHVYFKFSLAYVPVEHGTFEKMKV